MGYLYLYQFVVCIRMIADYFEKCSRLISTAGVNKSLSIVFCTMKHNICGSSVSNLLHANNPVVSIFKCRLHLYKIQTVRLTLHGTELNVNVGIIICVCLLIDISFPYPIEHNSFTVCMHSFSTTFYSYIFVYIYILLILIEIFIPHYKVLFILL
jgi:hypothetical protein